MIQTKYELFSPEMHPIVSRLPTFGLVFTLNISGLFKGRAPNLKTNRSTYREPSRVAGVHTLMQNIMHNCATLV